MKYTVYVSAGSSGPDYNWICLSEEDDYHIARQLATDMISSYEMVRIIDSENHIVFFEWRRK